MNSQIAAQVARAYAEQELSVFLNDRKDAAAEVLHAATLNVDGPSNESLLFDGGPNSLVAKAVGSAEGTRTPDGGRTSAYSGHKDPGNAVWNLGTFSYQHGASSPESADEKQLAVLRQQYRQMLKLALSRGVQLTLLEALNGIDLANQAPKAALDRGYIDWLAKARKSGFSGADGVLWARVRSYLDPDSGRWNAPGIGNTVDSISLDQERRMQAVSDAIAVHKGLVAGIALERKVVFPIAGQTLETARVTSPYGWRTHPIHGDLRLHAGVDYGAPMGTALVAPEGGTVIFAGNFQNGCGWGIKLIPHADPTITITFCHMESDTLSVHGARADSPGQLVEAGQKVGTVGMTGGTTGPHLHFGVFSNTVGGSLDPTSYTDRMRS